MKERLSKGVAAFLAALARRPRPRPPGTTIGSAARRAGYTDDEVRVGSELISAQEAKARLGAEWYLSSQFTGRELITEEGRRALDRHRQAG